MTFYTKKDLEEKIPYWGRDTIQKIFDDPNFPAQKQGKTHFVEEEALKKYLQVHHDSFNIEKI